MKYSLLQLTQAILEALEDDEVNSITDTASSLQVAHIVRETYFEMADELDLPSQYTIFNLASTGIASPTIMLVPDNVLSISWIKYNIQTTGDTGPKIRPVQYRELDTFLNSMYGINPTGDTTTFSYTYATDDTNFLNVLGHSNKFPDYWTSFDDKTLLFDSYSLADETNLTINRTQAYGLTATDFLLTDNFVPELEDKQFSLLLNEAKAQAFQDMQKHANEKAEKRARRGWVRSQRNKQGVPFPHNEYARLPNYGRIRSTPSNYSSINWLKDGNST